MPEFLCVVKGVGECMALVWFNAGICVLFVLVLCKVVWILTVADGGLEIVAFYEQGKWQSQCSIVYSSCLREGTKHMLLEHGVSPCYTGCTQGRGVAWSDIKGWALWSVCKALGVVIARLWTVVFYVRALSTWYLSMERILGVPDVRKGRVWPESDD